jgi:hypothetical protein
MEHLGYANYLTFTVGVWIDNSRDILPWVNRVADIFARLPDDNREVWFADWLRNYVQSTLPEDTGDNVGNTFLAHAMNEIDWLELSRKYIHRER